jgi:uncharacterized protein (DUF58 family)
VLTRQGWAVLIGAGVAAAAGRLFALAELYVVAAALAALVGGAAVSVRRRSLSLRVGREVSPRRVHAGTPARVELRVGNGGRFPTPVLRLHDPVTGTRGATVLFAPIEPEGRVRSAYRLPTERRGVLAVGPLEVSVEDPFGLARLRTVGAPVSELTVLPRVDEIRPPPPAGGDEPLAGARVTVAAAHAGDDFAALRGYVVGDDMRRVHWPSSARHDDLLVRQDEVHWQGRTTVVLDLRRSAHGTDGGPALEAAVSAAASVVAAAWRRGDLVRLITTDGLDTGHGAGAGHVEAVLERLATVRATNHGSLAAVAASLARDGSGGLVAILGLVGPTDLAAVAELRARFGSLTLVRVDAAAWGVATTGTTAALSDAGGAGGAVVTGPDRPFAPAWDQAMVARGAARRRVGGGRAGVLR